jgi:hypothetical protein
MGSTFSTLDALFPESRPDSIPDISSIFHGRDGISLARMRIVVSEGQLQRLSISTDLEDCGVERILDFTVCLKEELIEMSD